MRAEAAPGEPDAAMLDRFLYEMMFICRFEEKCGEQYTKGKIRGFLHLYTGQEACAVGAFAALRPDDKIVTHYRDHGHAVGFAAAVAAAFADGFVDYDPACRVGKLAALAAAAFLGGAGLVVDDCRHAGKLA